MTRPLRAFAAVALVVVLAITTVGCSGPSNQQAHDAILNFTKPYSSPSSSYFNPNSQYFDVGDVKIVKIGKPIEVEVMGIKGTVYPVKANLIARDGTPLGEKEFLIEKDPYGDCIATPIY
jgi:hypothetical protein